jgi:hypothetical protein
LEEEVLELIDILERVERLLAKCWILVASATRRSSASWYIWLVQGCLMGELISLPLLYLLLFLNCGLLQRQRLVLVSNSGSTCAVLSITLLGRLLAL